MELQGNFGFGARSAAATAITGAGTVPKMPVFTGANTIGNSQMSDNGFSVFIGTSTSSKALFEVNSTIQGTLFPRMTTAQRNGIPVGATENSLFIFNTSLQKYQFYNFPTTTWLTIESSAAGGETLAQTLANGNVSGAYDISMDNTQVIKATNGGGQLDLRTANKDGSISLSSDAGVYAKAWYVGNDTNVGYGFGTDYSQVDTLGWKFYNGAINRMFLTVAGALSIGNGTTAANVSSILDLTSTTLGFLTPRMTAVQKTAIGTPATGLLIYQTDGTAGFYTYNGAAWVAVSPASPTTLYSGDGTVGAGRVVTLTDSIAFNGANTTFSTQNGYWQGAAKILYINPNATTGNVFAGEDAGNLTMTGISNTTLGYQTLKANTTGTLNTAVGYSSLTANTTGASNTAVGYNSLVANTVGEWNTALGYNALATNITNSYSVAIGAYALTLSVANYNIAIGSEALRTNSTGTQNIAIGTCLVANTTGSSNVGIGWGSISANTTGVENIGIGPYSLNSSNGDYNIAIGQHAARYHTTGTQNIYIGAYSASTAAATTNSYNTTLGYNTLSANVGNGNIAVGWNCMGASTTGNDNTAIGKTALYGNTTGGENIAIGVQSLYANTTGSQNVAIGQSSLTNNSVGTDNTSLGYSTLFENKASSFNTAFGSNAMYNTGANVLTGSFVVGIDYTIDIVGDTDFTLIGAASNTIGVVFTALNVGNGTTGQAYPEANYNTAIGSNALYANINGANCVALGYQAGYYETASNSLYIHNGLGVTTLATGKTNSLIYGVFNATSSSQSISFNSQVFIRHDVTMYGEQVHLLGVDRTVTAATAGFSLTHYAGGAVVGGTDKNGGDYIIKSGISTGTGYADILAYSPTPTATGTGDNTPVIREKVYTRYMVDNATFNLEDSRSGQGWLMAGDGEEYAWFKFTSAGVVTLISNSANVSIVAATDNSINIYDNGTVVTIEQTFAAAKVVTVRVLYNT